MSSFPPLTCQCPRPAVVQLTSVILQNENFHAIRSPTLDSSLHPPQTSHLCLHCSLCASLPVQVFQKFLEECCDAVAKSEKAEVSHERIPQTPCYAVNYYTVWSVVCSFSLDASRCFLVTGMVLPWLAFFKRTA